MKNAFAVELGDSPVGFFRHEINGEATFGVIRARGTFAPMKITLRGSDSDRFWSDRREKTHLYFLRMRGTRRKER